MYEGDLLLLYSFFCKLLALFVMDTFEMILKGLKAGTSKRERESRRAGTRVGTVQQLCNESSCAMVTLKQLIFT